jgi:polyisoprenoid-binding protein YceI
VLIVIGIFIDTNLDMLRCLFILFLLLASSTLSLTAQEISINESDSRIDFVFTDDDVEGTLSDFQFTGAIDLSDLQSSEISGSVLMESLDTDNWFRDRHLRSKKYFNRKSFPRMIFKSNAISGTDNEFVVRGDLTIKGISKPVSFTFTKLPGKLRGTTVINTSDFDILIHDEIERNMVNITLTLPYTTQ